MDGDEAAPKKVVSKRAQRRQAKRDERRRIQEVRAARSKQKEDEEFQRIAQRVARLNQEVGTVVKEDMGCLEEEEAKDVQSPSKNNRRREPCVDVDAAIFQLNLWQASMKYGE